ncbi:MAG: hypothetical protein ACK55I_08975, partial [bacterium]
MEESIAEGDDLMRWHVTFSRFNPNLRVWEVGIADSPQGVRHIVDVGCLWVVRHQRQLVGPW